MSDTDDDILENLTTDSIRKLASRVADELKRRDAETPAEFEHRVHHMDDAEFGELIKKIW